MNVTGILTAQVTRYSRRAAPCLLLGSGYVLVTVPAYGSQFALPESGCYWGILVLLLFGNYAQRAGRYAEAFGASMVAMLWCLIAGALAGLMAVRTFVTPAAVIWSCRAAAAACPTPHVAALPGLDLAGAVVLAGLAAFYAGRIGVAIWRFAPIAAIPCGRRAPIPADAAPPVPGARRPGTGRVNY